MKMQQHKNPGIIIPLKSILIMGFAIAIGMNVTGCNSSPAANAANPTQIEYKQITLPDNFGAGSEQILNKLGAEGWDICYGFGETIFLKRVK